MNRSNKSKIICGLASLAIIANLNISTSAAGVANIMPVAGFALLLEEGTTVHKIIEELEEKKEYKEEIKEAEILGKILKGEIIVEKPIAMPEIEPLDIESIVADIKEVPTSFDKVPKLVEKEETQLNSSISVSGNETATEEKELLEDTDEIAEEEQDFSGLVIAQVNDYVNVRSIASEEGEIVGKLYDDSVGEFILEEDGWYKIKSGNTIGFVKAEFVVTGQEAIELAKEVGYRYATVLGETLRVRTEPSTESSILGLVPMGDELTVLEELDGWVKISIQEGEGYVSSEFVELGTDFVTAESKEEEESRKEKEDKNRQAARAAATAASSNSSASNKSGSVNAPTIASNGSMGSSVASFASQFVGNPYVYGGTSLTNGADCSGFVQSVYANFGIPLSRTSTSQRSEGTDVGGIGNAQPGDIVAYSGHVGIYAGNGQLIHASTSKTGIIVSNANYRQILSVRRIF